MSTKQQHQPSQRIVLARHAETEWSLRWKRENRVLDLWNDRSHLTSAIKETP